MDHNIKTIKVNGPIYQPIFIMNYTNFKHLKKKS